MSAKLNPMMLALPKKSREELRMSIDSYKGQNLINIRVWFRSETGDLHPTKKGVALQASGLPAIIDALTQLQASVEMEGGACD